MRSRSVITLKEEATVRYCTYVILTFCRQVQQFSNRSIRFNEYGLRFEFSGAQLLLKTRGKYRYTLISSFNPTECAFPLFLQLLSSSSIKYTVLTTEASSHQNKRQTQVSGGRQNTIFLMLIIFPSDDFFWKLDLLFMFSFMSNRASGR